MEFVVWYFLQKFDFRSNFFHVRGSEYISALYSTDFSTESYLVLFCTAYSLLLYRFFFSTPDFPLKLYGKVSLTARKKYKKECDTSRNHRFFIIFSC